MEKTSIPIAGAICCECGIQLFCISCKKPLIWSSTMDVAHDMCVEHKLKWLQFLNDGKKLSNGIRDHIIKYHCCSNQCEEFAEIFELLDGE